MLARVDLERVLRSLIADEIGRARKRAVAPSEFFRWSDETTLDEDGVGVDSVDKLTIVQRVNEFFHLHEVGSEDYLVMETRLGKWVDIVAETMSVRSERVTFRTSGSTGAPRPVTLELSHLVAELEALAPILGDPTRIIAWTPPHHIFGYLFGALLPSRLGLETVDGRFKAPSFFARAEKGDLHVATPFIWRRLFESAPDGGAGAHGLTSGAACPPELWRAAKASSLEALTEIYGASETSGVGYRQSAESAFELLPLWRRAPEDQDGDALILRSDPDEARIAAQDALRFSSDRCFEVVGRRDRAVQVAGVNVSLDQTRDALLAHPMVRDAAVRQDRADPDGRLKAFVVLAEPLLEDAVAGELQNWIRDRLAAPARPAHVQFGRDLPRNPAGKLMDWAT